ncbi:Protein HIRA [Chelonia mydas]|uniref:Protein HIRA n=1 Tax=Chelonia mydas TaxID=8469 RepID=M7BSV2_CHEMY|nr:Protein HIRA [Chelonia mydas]
MAFAGRLGSSSSSASSQVPASVVRPQLRPAANLLPAAPGSASRGIRPRARSGGKPIFSVDIHPDGTKFATGGQGQDSGKVVIWSMAPVLKEEDEKNENIPKMLCQMDNHLACVNCVRWSNNGVYLASGGDDKLIMVWKRAAYIGPSTVFGSSSKLANVEQWRCVSILRSHSGEILATLKGHSGLVKGLTWDPVGKYIASQADDRSLKVWRTMDWQLETSITKPFDECGGTTHVLRLSWSPDGHYLVSAHAMNNSGPTAQIIERDGWKTNMDFVGHRKAVTVVKFNPKIFKKKQKNGSSTKPSCPYCCCAVGSKDRSLSVWLTCLKRPLVVIHELFDKSIMDISWTLNGLGILVCSMDGSVAFLDFSQDELGDPLSEEEKSNIHQSTYGKSLAIMTEAQLSTTIIENPEMLKYQQRQQQQQMEQKNAAIREAAGTATAAPKVASMVNGESLEDIRKNLLKKQVETRTADGRRRITPLCIAQLDTGINATSASAAPPVSSSSVLTTPSKIEPMKAFDSRFTERSKATSGTSAVINTNQTAIDRLKDQNLIKENKPKDILESSSDSEEKIPATKPLSLPKRKLELEAETVEKKKKGRPRKDSRLVPVTLTVQSPAALASEKDATCISAPALALKLPTPIPQKSFTLQVSSDPSMYIEVENEMTTVGGSKLSRLKCNREGKEWETVLTSRILTAAGSCDVVSVACEKRTLSVFSACGRRLLPPIILHSPISALHCTGSYVMALTTIATLSVWDVHKQSVVVKDESLQTILAGRQAARLFSMPHLVQQETTLAYLENQIAAALMLQSSHEYRHWLLIYARYLVNEGFEYRLRELCKDLLGPVHYSAGSQWESTVVVHNMCRIHTFLWRKEIRSIVPWIKKFGTNPITGEAMSTLQTLQRHRCATCKYHCPVLFTVFTNNSHIVAIKTTGNVFAYEAVEQLNIKTKSYKDLLTDEPFTRQDILTLQDPTNLDKFNVSDFFHVKNNLKVTDPDEEKAKLDPSYYLKNTNLETRETLLELYKEFKGDDILAATMKAPEKRKVDKLNAAHYSTGTVSASFTSTAMAPETTHEAGQAPILTLFSPVANEGQSANSGFHCSSLVTGGARVQVGAGVQSLAKKSYFLGAGRCTLEMVMKNVFWKQGLSSHSEGKMYKFDHLAAVTEEYCHSEPDSKPVEIPHWPDSHCLQRALDLTISGTELKTLIWYRCNKSTAERSPIDSGTPPDRGAQAESTGERRLLTYRSEDATIQGGDPTGTGTGGESYWGKPFKDEFKPNLSHTGRGILSMANSGPNSNKSQFFITFRSCTYLDKKHTIFGRVVGGFEALTAMENVDSDPKTDRPKEEIRIKSITVFVDPYEEADAQISAEREKARQEEEAAKTKTKAVLPKKESQAPKTYRQGIGKYINMAATKRTADDDGPSTSAAVKKEKRSTGFGDFSSW